MQLIDFFDNAFDAAIEIEPKRPQKMLEAENQLIDCHLRGDTHARCGGGHAVNVRLDMKRHTPGAPTSEECGGYEKERCARANHKGIGQSNYGTDEPGQGPDLRDAPIAGSEQLPTAGRNQQSRNDPQGKCRQQRKRRCL